MGISKGNNKSLSYIFVLLSLFSIVFIAKPEYAFMNENSATKQDLLDKQNTLKIENDNLKNLEQELKNLSSTKSKQIEKYIVDFKENEIINYFYNYAEKNSLKMSINSLSLSNTTVNELGFKESTINLAVNFANEEAMISFLGELLNKNSIYKFFINSLSYPIEESKSSFSLTLPIKIFHK